MPPKQPRPRPPPSRGSESASFPAASDPSASSATATAHATPLATAHNYRGAVTDPGRPGRSDAAVYLETAGSGTRLHSDEIEMEPISPGGHRRRRSSLMNPANGIPNGRTRNQANTAEESKIEEEGAISGRRGDNSPDNALSDEDLHDDEETGLTHKDRRRKRIKKRRNTLLDQRIVRDKITAEEGQVADQHVVKRLLLNAALILLWYLFSLCISLYNKWMFDVDRLNFPFPLFTTAVHMLVQFSLATLVLYFIPSLRPQNAIHRSDLGQSRHESGPERPIMTKMFYLTRIGPCGAATGLDIGLGNTSLKFITLTFYTMCKSSSLAFVLLFAFLFRLESPTWKLVAVIATMTVGVIMMVADETEFKLGGFILVISAAFFSGFRWGLTQILLLRNPATSNPFSSIFFLAPVMFATLALIAIPAEGFLALLDGLSALVDQWGPFWTPLIILFPGSIAFLMTASEFALLQRTSVVTLSIAGIFKEAVTIAAAAIVLGDRLTNPVNISGLFVTLGSIAAYNYMKITKMREEARQELHQGHGGAAEGGGATSSSGSGSDLDVDNDDGGGEDAGLLRHGEVDSIPMVAPLPSVDVPR